MANLLRKRIQFSQRVWNRYEEISNPSLGGKEVPIICSSELLLNCHICGECLGHAELRKHLMAKHEDHIFECILCAVLMNAITVNVDDMQPKVSLERLKSPQVKVEEVAISEEEVAEEDNNDDHDDVDDTIDETYPDDDLSEAEEPEEEEEKDQDTVVTEKLKSNPLNTLKGRERSRR